MAERPWGFWTESKLDMLSAYLLAFTTASKKAPSTVYLDLFAGQATNISRDTGNRIEGSLRRALRTEPPFTVLRGFELKQQRARSLQDAVRAEFPDRDVVVHAGDVHDALRSALGALAPYRWSPTFAFIDPDGVEARWELLEALAAHKASGQTKVELFLLLASPQVVRVVNDSLDPDDLQHAEQSGHQFIRIDPVAAHPRRTPIGRPRRGAHPGRADEPHALAAGEDAGLWLHPHSAPDQRQRRPALRHDLRH